MNRLFDVLRIVLGLVLFLTAFDYFMPATVPVITQQSFDDPMAARLVGTLDASGLFAVGKFFQIAGGLLLLSNRMVPFALAGVLPTLVCGTFIAVVLEGDPMPALAALALLALNGFLMLCYLPSYARVLQAGHLADGEAAQPGANYESLFVNPLSGAPAKACLAAGAVWLLAVAFYWQYVFGEPGVTGLVVLAVPGLILLAGLVRAVTSKGGD